jgi:hypothetical protein
MKSQEHYKQQRIARETIAREAALIRFLSDTTPEIEDLKFTVRFQKMALGLTLLFAFCLFLQNFYIAHIG